MIFSTLTSLLALSAIVAPPKLAVHAVRFYSPAAGQTSVVAILQVPYALADAAGDRLAWKTTIQVNDASGMTVYEESWWRGVPAAMQQPDAYGMEPLKFPPMKPGTYTIVATVQDSATGRTATTQTAVDAFSAPPSVSDLLLASSMRMAADAGDTVLGPGEIARGMLRFVTSPELILNPLTPGLAFMLEAYSVRESEVSTVLEVRDSTGKAVFTVPFRQKLLEGGGIIRGILPLDGLPEGTYSLSAAVTLNGQRIERLGAFSVGNIDVALAREVAARQVDQLTDEGYFGAMNEDAVDAAAEALQPLATSRELSVYKASGEGRLSLSAKRKFLIDYWASRDQNKATAANETRIAYYDAIAFANREYAETGRNARPGWKTDRGRVFVRHGKPGEIHAQLQSGRAPPYQIWRYTSGRMRYYVFADRNNLGAYTLMKSNDLKEPGNSGWLDIMTPDVVRDIGQYLGINLFETSPGSTLGTGTP